MTTFRKTIRARGATMIEMIVYGFILVMIVSVVIYALIALANLYRSIKSAAAIEAAAHVGLERMTREIRGALSVDDAQSTFSSAAGQLTLNTYDDNGATTTVRFFMSGQTPHLAKGGVDRGPLSSTDVRVTSLIFRKISTVRSEGVKIEMVVESGSGKSYRTESFYSTTVLRGSYPIQ